MARSYMVLALLCAPVLAFALERDRDQPMDVEADTTDAELGANGRAVLSGNVVIRQGSLKIDAARATVQKRAGDFSRILLEGSPAKLEQQLDSGGLTRAEANAIDYDPQAETVLLTGNVVVTQPEGQLRGERITYNMQTGHLQGGDDGGRVRMRIEPRAPRPTD